MIIFVGDKPSPKMKLGAKPFEGAVCERRLKSWVTRVTNIIHRRRKVGKYNYRIINQCDYAYANFLAMTVRDGHKLIALGSNASKALRDIPHFKLPHPSARNRQINDREFIAKKLAECKEWLRA